MFLPIIDGDIKYEQLYIQQMTHANEKKRKKNRVNVTMSKMSENCMNIDMEFI